MEARVELGKAFGHDVRVPPSREIHLAHIEHPATLCACSWYCGSDAQQIELTTWSTKPSDPFRPT
jgi:hypothetical protein